MEEKSKQIWFRFNNDQKQLKVDCVDLLTKCYMMLGQKPEAQQIVIMAQFLYEDLINNYSRMTLEEVYFALEKGIRQGEEASCFINVRSWNLLLKEHKKSEALKRQQRLITDYQKHEQSQKAIGNTINKAKQLK